MVLNWTKSQIEAETYLLVDSNDKAVASYQKYNNDQWQGRFLCHSTRWYKTQEEVHRAVCTLIDNITHEIQNNLPAVSDLSFLDRE